MRLKNMYFICKNNLETMKSIKREEHKLSSGRIDWVCIGSKSLLKVFRELNLIDILEPFTEKLLGFIKANSIYVEYDKQDFFNKNLAEVIKRMEVIIELGDSVGFEEYENGFDIKLPDNISFDELSSCISDLNKVFNQCPYLNTTDSKIEFKNVDVGSKWLTFMTICTGATVLLTSLAYIVDKAVKVASHIVTTKQQTEQLKAMQLGNDLIKSQKKIFDAYGDALLNKCVSELKNEIGNLENGEEEERLRRHLLMLGDWMSKGLQIYSAIESPQEIKDLFPAAEKQTALLKGIELLAEHSVNGIGEVSE